MQVFTALLLLLFTEDNPCPGRRKIICTTYSKKFKMGPTDRRFQKARAVSGSSPLFRISKSIGDCATNQDKTKKNGLLRILSIIESCTCIHKVLYEAQYVEYCCRRRAFLLCFLHLRHDKEPCSTAFERSNDF